MSTATKRESELRLQRDLVLIGAHGGAGVTTLHQLLGEGTWDLGCLPVGGAPPRFRLGDRALVLVARWSVSGANRALAAVGAITDTGQQVDALVVVADGYGREPRDARVRFRMLEPSVERIVHMPYVSGLRLVVDPCEVALPRRAQDALAAIAELGEPLARRSSRTWMKGR